MQSPATEGNTKPQDRDSPRPFADDEAAEAPLPSQIEHRPLTAPIDPTSRKGMAI